MDLVLLIIGFLCVLIGVIGSVLPALPGPGLSWIGLLFLYFTKTVPTNYWVLGSTFLITLFIIILDYLIPSLGTKRLGGSKYGVWGANIGLIVGLFIPPFGFVIGPFIGACLGELYFDSQNFSRAFKAALGAFIGFIASTLIKLTVCIAYLGWYMYVFWTYRNQWV
ncbi:hypothetical protein BWK63_12280 [Flavobacterium covae]|uniref:DUF456 domain-containing protein n=1 Tax=Flavobacterium covae TaxID=2906076 RepID=A0ABW8PJF4_9FLAO|nr:MULTISPECIES: DUF456 domain-containing protein [Flavobacterium]MCJ1807531.1 DUF456 domain-containing protein [Flavobacterium covae]OWP80205.1 hypothetical protein BWK63_12280 [Flavobacterium covae]OXA79733.1 hypothetical protein B0A56_07510 [Flavobacterium columnare NBRC 100251 = ATCC 23463]POR20862.1 hypothetical protein BWK57_12165 [Flavobacterium columnare]